MVCLVSLWTHWISSEFCFVFSQNLLGGALYGTWPAFLLTSVLTASGATLCYSVSSLAGASIVHRFLSHRVASLQSRMANSKGFNFFLLLVTFRLFPFTPNWALNIIAPHLSVPAGYFFGSVFVGKSG